MTGNLAVATSIARQLAASAQTTEARSAARLQLDRIAAAREAGASSDASIPGGEPAEQLNTLGLDAYNEGRYQEALEYFRRATEKDPRQPFAWNNLGRAYGRLDRHEDAIAAYRQQIAVSPEDGFAHRNLAGELWLAGQTADAERELARHLEIKPQDLDATLDLGRLQWAAGETIEALATFERATRSSDVHAVALIEQAALARSLGDSAKAIAAVEAALARTPAPGDYADAALLFTEPPPDLVRAEEYATRAVGDATTRLAQLSFDDGIKQRQALGYALGTAWNALGSIALKRQDVAAAEPHLQASWWLLGDPFLAEMLGRICLSKGQRQRALEWFARGADGQGGQGARKQLEKLLPDPAKREALLAQVRRQISSGGEIDVPASPGVTGSARVALLIGASGNVEDSRVVEGDSAFSAIAPGLTGIAVQSPTPGHEVGHLVRIGRVTCEAGQARCRLGLEPLFAAGSNRRFVR